ncbi:MAG TPA: sugar phosphate isomerase/epimerase family protein [Chitinophaga sp.]|uniref:sugar phosphate isomerase/epimerase family protein n=1 Tax=Chitinophaga sp. TaxID=1869181 RepID=UPI002CCA7E7E|nr:sugar phosphate isomerase/epimerase family protein [Chitinophaga sp.]HVI48650.1 sugar phosphate isomerase/epimerase family protein [Chitinophaga sp.]
MKIVLILLTLPLACLFLQSNAQNRYPSIGIATSMDNDSLAYANGFVYLEETVKKLLSPAVNDSVFESNLLKIRKMKCRLETCNVFIPGQIKLVGPAVNEEKVLEFVEQVMQRAQKAGIRLIVLGSGDARRLPEGVNAAAARSSFIPLGRKMAEIARKYNCLIAMENLNSTETNFVNKLTDAYAIASAINHPNFMVTADIYHMLKEGESPLSIEQAKDRLVHCHIAEKELRTAPGVAGDDFRPYFRALKKAGYQGRIMMECRWDDPARQYKPALTYLETQLKEAYDAR